MTRRVLVAEFTHETNTFSVQATDEAAFRRGALQLGHEVPAAYRGTQTALGAAFEAAAELGLSLVHPVAAHADPAGRVTTSSSTAWLDHPHGGSREPLADVSESATGEQRRFPFRLEEPASEATRIRLNRARRANDGFWKPVPRL